MEVETSATLRALETFTSMHTQQPGVLAVATHTRGLACFGFCYPEHQSACCSIWLLGTLGSLSLKGRECHLQSPLKSLDANQMPKFGLEAKG